jgi:hypothetical protein
MEYPHLNLDEKPDMYIRLFFYFLQENKLKIFLWKLIQFIIPTTKLLTVWRLSNNVLTSY